MRVFESLNCILCKKPFARVACQPRSPVQLGCGLAMCHECFGKEAATTDEKERKHQCGERACFHNADFAYFLIDVLSQENALMLTPMGYLLLKPFKIPECPICHDEYSNEIEEKKSFALLCGHIICTECYLKTRQKLYEHSNDYQIKCPTCTNIYVEFGSVTKQKDRLYDFLNELPEMTRQMKAMMNAARNVKDECSCNQCHEKDVIDKMFYCSTCSFEICGACAYKKHRSHEAIPLLEKQANQTLMELQQESKNVIKTYKDLFPELHKELLEGVDIFETKLLSKEENLTDASTMADLQEKHESFTKIKSKFETSAENYLPHLRKFDTEVRELIQTLDTPVTPDDTPVLKKPKMETDT